MSLLAGYFSKRRYFDTYEVGSCEDIFDQSLVVAKASFSDFIKTSITNGLTVLDFYSFNLTSIDQKTDIGGLNNGNALIEDS